MTKVIIEVKTLQNETLIGRIVVSKAGRDKDNCYIVVGVIPDSYVLLANGDTKTIRNPKKKKLKHIVLTEVIDDEIKALILSQDKNADLKIKRFLKLNGIIKEA